MDFQFSTLQEAKAAQILLLDYAIESEVDEYENILTTYENVQFEDEDMNYIDSMVSYLGDELLVGYDAATYRAMYVDLFGVMGLDEYMRDFSLCLCDDELSRLCEGLPHEQGYYDVYVHYNRETFASTRNNDIIYTTQEVAQHIIEDEEWNREDSIRLVSCWAGTTSVYQDISDIIGVHVKAPLGRIVVLPSQGRFWVVLDEWFVVDDTLPPNEQFMQVKIQFAKMYINDDERLSDSVQNTLWVEC